MVKVENMAARGVKVAPDLVERLKVLETRPISSWPWPRVAAYIPIERTLSYAEHVLPAFWALAEQGLPAIWINYKPVDLARNEAAKAFLETDYTHLLMMDSDMIHPPDTVQQLCKWVINDPEVQVIGGLCFSRHGQHIPLAWRQNADRTYIELVTAWERGALGEVDGIGGGCFMVAREVFERLPYPWFRTWYKSGEWQSEDGTFFEDCRKAGIKIYVDTAVQPVHVGEQLITRETWEATLQREAPDDWALVERTRLELGIVGERKAATPEERKAVMQARLRKSALGAQ